MLVLTKVDSIKNSVRSNHFRDGTSTSHPELSAILASWGLLRLSAENHAKNCIIPTALSTDLCPRACSDGSNGVWVVCEEVPRVAAGVDDVVVAFEDADGEFVGAQVGPDVFDRVQFRAVWRQGQQGEIVGDDKGI